METARAGQINGNIHQNMLMENTLSFILRGALNYNIIPYFNCKRHIAEPGGLNNFTTR